MKFEMGAKKSMQMSEGMVSIDRWGSTMLYGTLAFLFSLALAGGCNKGEIDIQTSPTDESSVVNTGSSSIEGEVRKPSKETYKPTYPVWTMPEEVLGVIGLTGLEQVVQALNIMGTGVLQDEMPPNLASLAVEQMKEILGFVDMSWLPRDEPIRLIIADPKKYAGKGLVFILPITDRQKFKESIAPEQLRGLVDTGFKYEHDYQVYHVELIPGYAVIADRPNFYESVRDFTLDTIEWKPPHLLSFKVSVANLRRIYDFEYAKFKDDLALRILGDAEADLPTAWRSFWAKAFGNVIDFGDAVEQVDLQLDIPAGNAARVNLVLSSERGSPLETLARLIVGQTCSIADRIGKETAVSLATRLDLRSIEAVNAQRRLLLNVVAELVDMTRQEAQLLDSLVERFWMLGTGENVLAFHPDASFPYGVTYLTQFAQPDVAQSLLGEIFELLGPRTWMALDIGQVKNAEELLWGLSEIAKEFGGKWVTVIEEEDGIEFAGVRFDVDWGKILWSESDDPGWLDIVKRVMGSHFELVFAFKGSMMGFAFGPNGFDNVVQLFTKEAMRADPVFTDLAEKSALTVSARVDLMLRLALPIFEFFGKLLEPTTEALQATAALTSDGNQLNLAVDLPFDTIKSLVGMSVKPWADKGQLDGSGILGDVPSVAPGDSAIPAAPAEESGNGAEDAPGVPSGSGVGDVPSVAPGDSAIPAAPAEESGNGVEDAPGAPAGSDVRGGLPPVAPGDSAISAEATENLAKLIKEGASNGLKDDGKAAPSGAETAQPTSP